MNSPLEDTVRDRFFAPAIAALNAASRGRSCLEYTDETFIIGGIGRVIEIVQSGRDWVQRLQVRLKCTVSVGTFFQALRSNRRLALTEEVAAHIRDQVDQDCDEKHDPLAEHPELEGFEIFASDGHYEAAATHTKPIAGKLYAQGFIFSLNLRTHSLSFLTVAQPKEGKKKESEITAMKRLSATQLRLSTPKGTKVIHVYDPAVIDYRQWFNWKTRGIYIISREKVNSKASVIGLREFDYQDPRNIGVLADEWVGVFAGIMLRRVRYEDPATGNVFSFLTTEFTLPPGLIAFLYKLRWDIEKCYDEKKNKFLEKKTWATTDTAKSNQAHFLCMAHNLLVLLERKLERDENLRDEKLYEKRAKRLKELKRQIESSGRNANPMVLNCDRITQRSLQFIRWLRNAIVVPTSWNDAIKLLRPLMAKYLS
jgi:hypothetical protein